MRGIDYTWMITGLVVVDVAAGTIALLLNLAGVQRPKPMLSLFLGRGKLERIVKVQTFRAGV